MKTLSVKTILLIFVFYLTSFPLRSENIVILKVYTFNRPPLYTVKNNKFSGTLVDKTRKIFDKAGISYKFVQMPPKRILYKLTKEKNACSIGWFKTKEREKLFIYSKPICSESDYFIIAAKKSLNADFTHILKSPLFSIALVNGFSYGDEIDNMLKNSKIKKFYVPDADARKLLLMIKNNRVDLAILSKEEAEFFLNKDGLKNDIKLIPFREKIIIKRYIILKKKTDKKIIERINKAIEQLN